MDDYRTDFDAKNASQTGTTMGEFMKDNCPDSESYRGYTLDDGIMCVVWNSADEFMGKFDNKTQAKSVIDSWLDA